MTKPSTAPLRTPDERFASLPDFPYPPNYIHVQANGVNDNQPPMLRMHYLDVLPSSAARANNDEVIVLLHGEPSWCYLYRHMIKHLTDAGYRCLAPDLIGFGRSDKPRSKSDYTYDRHVQWLTEWFVQLKLRNITLFCQDWGSLLGLAIVGNPVMTERFARVMLSNGGLPTGDYKPTAGFYAWQSYAKKQTAMNVGKLIQGAVTRKMSAEETAAYDAPFPTADYQAGALQFPLLVPTPQNPYPANRQAWKQLQQFKRPFLTVFGADDQVTRGGEKPFIKTVPGAAGLPHAVLQTVNHFCQEDAPQELSTRLIQLVESHPLESLEFNKQLSKL